MSKPDILGGTQRLYIVARRLLINKAEILDYRLGKDGEPLIVVSSNPLRSLDLVNHTGRQIPESEPVITEGGFNCVRYYGVSVVWKN